MTAPVIDWSILLACDVCGARLNEPCRTLTSGGPEALPPQFADRPHSSRKVSGSQVSRLRANSAKPLRTPQPARRASKSREMEIKAWMAKRRSTDG